MLIKEQFHTKLENALHAYLQDLQYEKAVITEFLIRNLESGKLPIKNDNVLVTCPLLEEIVKMTKSESDVLAFFTDLEDKTRVRYKLEGYYT